MREADTFVAGFLVMLAVFSIFIGIGNGAVYAELIGADTPTLPFQSLLIKAYAVLLVVSLSAVVYRDALAPLADASEKPVRLPARYRNLAHTAWIVGSMFCTAMVLIVVARTVGSGSGISFEPGTTEAAAMVNAVSLWGISILVLAAVSYYLLAEYANPVELTVGVSSENG